MENEMAIKVLWVEEEPDSVRFEMAIAKNMNWDIEQVNSAMKAIELINKKKFDLIILDIIIPIDEFNSKRGLISDEGGIRVLEEIRNPNRKKGTDNNVKVIIITCVMTPKKKEKIIKLLESEKYYISKPIKQKEFIYFLNKVNEELTTSKY